MMMAGPSRWASIGRSEASKLARIERTRRQFLLAREGQQSGGERSAARGALHRGVQQARRARIVGRQPPGEQLQAALDDHQQVVEVVRDTAGQAAQRLQLLRLAQRGLGAVARGDVVDHRQAVQEAPGHRIAFGTRGEDDVGNLTRGLDQAVLHRPAFPGGTVSISSGTAFWRYRDAEGGSRKSANEWPIAWALA